MRINKNQRLILGPPGTGKTTTILNKIEQLLSAGTSPERIAFVSFTKKAVNEAITRACVRFNLDKERFKSFKTIHALCFQELGMNRSRMLGRADLTELGNLLGYRFNTSFISDEGQILFPDDDKGSQIYFLDNFARIAGCDHNRARIETGVRMGLAEMENFSRRYKQFKESRGKYDFTDLLEQYAEKGDPLDVDYFFVDEAQDLSVAQWRVLQRAATRANEVTICGDDDQSIFKWAGASLKTFLSLEGEKEVLAKSYRLPSVIHRRAQEIISRVTDRFTKEFSSTDKEGSIITATTFDQIQLEENESVLVLVRNTYLLQPIYSFLEQQSVQFTGRGNVKSVEGEHIRAILLWEKVRKGEGITLEEARLVYSHLRVGEGILSRGGKAALLRTNEEQELLTFETLRDNYGLMDAPIWHKALQGISHSKREYYVSLLKKGEKLTKTADVAVNTIHGTKGGEADHVIIVPDMAKRSYDHSKLDPDSEVRVAYVAITRARKRVTLLQPNSKFFFDYRI